MTQLNARSIRRNFARAEKARVKLSNNRIAGDLLLQSTANGATPARGVPQAFDGMLQKVMKKLLAPSLLMFILACLMLMAMYSVSIRATPPNPTSRECRTVG
jgi:hypothetical protein